MPYLLLGPDDFSKKGFIDYLATKLNAEVVVFRQDDALPTLSAMFQTDLFSKAKVFVCEGVVPDFSQGFLDFSQSKNRVVISVASLDKRKKENKELLSNETIEVKEFNLPHSRELDEWILNRVKELGGSINKSAIDLLAKKLGRDDAKETKVGGKVIAVEEVYNLWQADGEIRKLIAFADGREITVEDVSALVSENKEVEAFAISNALGDGKAAEALNLINTFLKDEAGSDEKGAIIQLNALLAEQFRNAAMISDFVARKVSDDDILEKTGWKSGRLFVMKKIASRFPTKKLLETLTKLEALDQELKSSSTPPKVLLDLIISQLI